VAIRRLVRNFELHLHAYRPSNVRFISTKASRSFYTFDHLHIIQGPGDLGYHLFTFPIHLRITSVIMEATSQIVDVDMADDMDIDIDLGPDYTELPQAVSDDQPSLMSTEVINTIQLGDHLHLNC
jgi:hypothetical protein